MATAKATEHKGMVWLAGGAVRMGDERFYPEEQPVVERLVDALLGGRAPGDQCAVPSLRRRHGTRHHR